MSTTKSKGFIARIYDEPFFYLAIKFFSSTSSNLSIVLSATVFQYFLCIISQEITFFTVIYMKSTKKGHLVRLPLRDGFTLIILLYVLSHTLRLQ